MSDDWPADVHPGDPSDGERACLAAGFGALLRAERLAAGLTQPALAAATGLHTKTVCRFEKGRMRPRVSTVRVLAAALVVTQPGRLAEVLADELVAAAGASLRPESGTGQARRGRAVERYRRGVERAAAAPVWVKVPTDAERRAEVAPAVVGLAPVVDLGARRRARGDAGGAAPVDAEVDGWPPVAHPPVALSRREVEPGEFTAEMFEVLSPTELLSELRRFPFSEQVQIVARALDLPTSDADDHLWGLYALPGAPTPR